MKQQFENKPIIFYNIPDYSRYLIAIEGKVINIVTNNYLQGSYNPAGYYNFRLTRDDGKVHTWGLHRLLCYVFKPIPEELKNFPLEDLEVNHVDGIKANNELSNLEWCTRIENIEHAGYNNLTSKCLPIQVRDVDTGIVHEYPSAISYSRISNMSKDSILYRLKAGSQRIFPERKQYRVRSNEDWPVVINIDAELAKNGSDKGVILRNLLTKEIITFPTIKHCAKYLKVHHVTVSKWINRDNQPILPGYIQLKFLSDTSPWREVTDPGKELYNNYNRKTPIIVTHGVSNEQYLFDSQIECCKKMKISPTSLNYRLRSEGNTVFKDGFKYEYVSMNSPLLG